MLDVRPLGIDGVLEIRPQRFSDDRGFFSEVWNIASWRDAGVDMDFVQDNHSRSREAGVLRGLHYQLEPAAQDKLVRVVKGRIFDVAVDLRAASPTFGKWVAAELSESEWNQLLVPKGFAHGFLTLEPNCEVLYKVSASYSPELERSIRFDDPDLAIAWPRLPGEFTLSDRDGAAPSFRQQMDELR